MSRWMLAVFVSVCLADRIGQADATYAGTPAAVTVYVPVGATLTIDGRRTEQMTAVRHFVSPPLPGGRFAYTLRAEYTWFGQPTARQARVEVWAGANVVVDMMTAELQPPPAPRINAPAAWSKPSE